MNIEELKQSTKELSERFENLYKQSTNLMKTLEDRLNENICKEQEQIRIHDT